AALIALMEANGVPGGPINTVAEALEEPQVLARGLKIAPEGLAGLRSPLRFSRSALALDRAAPALGTGDWAFAPRD
uniref:CoA transferase n=1 Tax=Pararhodobacter sp. TaxID=2127056 RepID=UPI002AFE3532